MWNPCRQCTPCWGSKCDTDEELAASMYIDQELRRNKKAYCELVRIILLGAGDTGKTTIAKQMQIIHMDGFKDRERLYYRDLVRSNIFSAIECLIEGSVILHEEEHIPGTLIQPKNQKLADELLTYCKSLNRIDLTQEWVNKMKVLLQDTGIKETLKYMNLINFQETAIHFFQKIDQYVNHFLPTDEDILRVRQKSCGVKEMRYPQGKYLFHLIDVGGQRGERRKWITHFVDIQCVLYCISLSDFDSRLAEDRSVNRMHEAAHLFKSMVNNSIFASTPFIIFFNKYDLFHIKIQHVDLNVCFPNYHGGLNEASALEFIREYFLKLAEPGKGRSIYWHVTTATDTELIRSVFDSVRDSILNSVLRNVNL